MHNQESGLKIRTHCRDSDLRYFAHQGGGMVLRHMMSLPRLVLLRLPATSAVVGRIKWRNKATSNGGINLEVPKCWKASVQSWGVSIFEYTEALGPPC
jgi:hypothetical protein